MLWVEYPVLTLLPVVVFATAFWSLRRAGLANRGLAVATVLWGVYALYEGVMYLWAQRVVAPIRIDLILLGPLMYLVTVLGVVSWRRARSDRRARAA